MSFNTSASRENIAAQAALFGGYLAGTVSALSILFFALLNVAIPSGVKVGMILALLFLLSEAKEWPFRYNTVRGTSTDLVYRMNRRDGSMSKECATNAFSIFATTAFVWFLGIWVTTGCVGALFWILYYGWQLQLTV